MFTEQTWERGENCFREEGLSDATAESKPRANSGLLMRWRQRRSTSLNPLNAHEYGKNPRRVLTQIATVPRLVHRLGETVALGAVEGDGRHHGGLGGGARL
jgi:hypothetical protein